MNDVTLQGFHTLNESCDIVGVDSVLLHVHIFMDVDICRQHALHVT